MSALLLAAALGAQDAAPDAPGSAGGEEAYYHSGIGEDDFSLSIRATIRGEDYYHSGRYEAALEEFNKAVELAPDQMYAAWIGRGNLYYFVFKEYGKALADYNEVIRRVPEDYEPDTYEFIRRSAPGQVFFAYYGRGNVYGAWENMKTPQPIIRRPYGCGPNTPRPIFSAPTHIPLWVNRITR